MNPIASPPARVTLHHRENAGCTVHHGVGVHLLDERRGAPGRFRCGRELLDVVVTAAVWPARPPYRPGLSLEPDEARHPVGVRRRQERSDHPAVTRCEDGRPLHVGGVEHRQHVGRARLQVRQTAHVVGQAGTATVVEAQACDRRELVEEPRSGLELEEHLDVGRDRARDRDLRRSFAEKLVGDEPAVEGLCVPRLGDVHVSASTGGGDCRRRHVDARQRSEAQGSSPETSTAV
jgi:hypothetical protein